MDCDAATRDFYASLGHNLGPSLPYPTDQYFTEYRNRLEGKEPVRKMDWEDRDIKMGFEQAVMVCTTAHRLRVSGNGRCWSQGNDDERSVDEGLAGYTGSMGVQGASPCCPFQIVVVGAAHCCADCCIRGVEVSRIKPGP